MSGTASTGQSRRTTALVDLGILLLLAAALYLPGLGTRDLWNPNEPIYGRAVVEMAERGDWLIPTINGTPFAEKPILYYWMALAASGVAGEVTETTLRVPSVVVTVATLFLTYFLVLPYSGRRRALLTGLLLGTTYGVFWCARWVQMDSLALVFTTAVLLPLSRMADHGLAPRRAWLWAGVAAGLGFMAKGPVVVLLPALVFTAYVLATRRPALIWSPRAALAALPFAALVLPWLGLLYLDGQGEFLHEMLIRQNFGRFVDAWDHQHPWPYYLKYLLLDYAPWSLFAPLALFGPRPGNGDRRLRTLAVCWIAAIVIFFSLSDSKRAPYILPVAPAMAMLAASGLHRLFQPQLTRRWMVAGSWLFGFWAIVFAATGLFLLVSPAPELQGRQVLTRCLATLLIAGAVAMAAGLLQRFQFRLAFGALASVTLGIYVCGAVWLLPAGNQWKSARAFCAGIDRVMSTGDRVRSYRLWDWRAEYAYYLGRDVRNIHDASLLRRYWTGEGRQLLIVEGDDDVLEAQNMLGAVPTVADRIAGRRVYLFEKPTPADRPPAESTPGRPSVELALRSDPAHRTFNYSALSQQ